MTFTQSIAACFGKYATFAGRAARSEFWWFYLFYVLLAWAGSVVNGVGGGAATGLIHLVFLLPILAAMARRLHDTGRSGWWLLLIPTIIGLIPLIFWWAQPGAQQENDYGAAIAAA